ncbi:MAG TPA: sugar phosphate isomerase/epimerase family protein [Pedobacter sp.]|uniref:hydroxypyruvate isomerase family protein n=1 Tax=Pedobacter sp. TaxID=1411316 RepID=UPI002CF1A7C8|nr:sugar phosphate isomerase/epimerase family protein [Pedobacter sp.]HMI02871.1 sugar phosphate isomerase/epimerase family protein [Pedobacter sp.]
MKPELSRRSALKNIVAGTAALGVSATLPAFALEPQKSTMLKGNVNHSVCRWCYGSTDLETLCIEAKKIGLKAIDLVGPEDWATLKKHGLDSSLCNGAEISIDNGWNEPQYHAELIKRYSEMIPKVAEAGYKQLICFSGTKRGKDNETGWKNCVEGLKQIIPIAEKHKVVLVMELLNSKVNHKDYQCDNTPWGVELCKRLGSENFKLLYDIYHMQIDEGNVISTIKNNHQYISHYHTGGVPGRNELDETQELYYPAIIKAILETGFKGYLAQEFIPKYKDKFKSLKDSVMVCDV